MNKSNTSTTNADVVIRAEDGAIMTGKKAPGQKLLGCAVEIDERGRVLITTRDGQFPWDAPATNGGLSEMVNLSISTAGVASARRYSARSG